ncbi:MAG: PilT/PilU family type 4a pilus ATPase [Verrucomicrobiales bacterium]|nr:PilT/PilU family type 4a pilus ATPase [Verrucomicrobiales bacterium]MCP5528119.1 PilT/PilU family type 4a pilus ATPase [Verrucomicrobiales bacterium]
MAPGSHLSQLLAWCEAQHASDLHLRVGRRPSVRIDGALRRVPDQIAGAKDPIEVQAWMTEAFPEATAARVLAARELDLSFQHGALRYRANFSKQRGLQACSFRVVPQQRMKLSDLQLPDTLAELVEEPRGWILATGPTGQGKSTTIRALLQEVNENRALRVITIEDPIEYVFADELAEFEQREVGIDTASFADGIRNAMRQDPDVIFVGEIRDRDSIFAAMQAAETGHLVLATLHADSVAQAIARLREHFPAAEQPNLSSLLARNLKAVVCQRLLPNTSGVRTPCLEIMKRDAGVEEAIRNNNLHLLSGIIEVSVNRGMHTFDQYLIELLAEGIITEATALQYAVNRHKLELTLRGLAPQNPILRPDPER